MIGFLLLAAFWLWAFGAGRTYEQLQTHPRHFTPLPASMKRIVHLGVALIWFVPMGYAMFEEIKQAIERQQ